MSSPAWNNREALLVREGYFLFRYVGVVVANDDGTYSTLATFGATNLESAKRAVSAELNERLRNGNLPKHAYSGAVLTHETIDITPNVAPQDDASGYAFVVVATFGKHEAVSAYLRQSIYGNLGGEQ
jgi:hypothetical protein